MFGVSTMNEYLHFGSWSSTLQVLFENKLRLLQRISDIVHHVFNILLRAAGAVLTMNTTIAVTDCFSAPTTINSAVSHAVVLLIFSRDVPNIQFVFASVPNNGPNSLFVFGRKRHHNEYE